MTRLEQLRIDAVLTPEQLAAKVEVSAGTIRRLEQGKGAQVATLGKLAAFFEIKPSELLREVDSPSVPSPGEKAA